MPVLIKDALLETQFAITIWDLSPLGGDPVNHRVPFGGTTISLFDEDGFIRQGTQKCRVHRHKEADGTADTTTPAIPDQRTREALEEELSPEEKELERLEGLLKKHEMGEIEHVDWLDKLVFEAVEKQKAKAEKAARRRAAKKQAEREKLHAEAQARGDAKPLTAEEKFRMNSDLENFYLYIELPRYDFPIIFEDFYYDEQPTEESDSKSKPGQGGRSSKPAPEVHLGPGIADGGLGDWADVFKVYDPEIGQKSNPVEEKHRRLTRSRRTGFMDRDLKPNPKTRDELNDIMSYGPSQDLSSAEKDLVWKFRYHLTRDKRALTKFVKSVNWEDKNEALQAVEILPKWTEIDVDDALELLGPTFDNPEVRAYAVDRLRKSDDEELP
ncbi:Phosphatidylinositol (PI) 3-kinase [Ascosphaera atra]|nr:Phosphatidylinositol (PI) 3-kinase [Ascosphaera atra]